MEGRLLKYFFQEICFSSGKQTIHKVSAAFTVKNCHPRTSLTNIFRAESGKPLDTFSYQDYHIEEHSFQKLGTCSSLVNLSDD